jgi:prepilin-type processing-associated H-X9-DG protein
MKQLGNAEVMYMQDYDGGIQELIPGGAASRAGKVGEPSMWMGTLQPYIKNTDIFRCPSSIIPKVDITYAGRATCSIGMNAFLGWYFNYFYEIVLHEDESNPAYPRPVRETLIQYPAQTVLFCDGFDRTVGSVTPRAYWANPVNGKGIQFGVSDRHMQGTNVTFVDGHAKWYKTNSLLNQKAIDERASANAIEGSNYNAAGVIWDVDAPNPYTHPNRWPTACCRD